MEDLLPKNIGQQIKPESHGEYIRLLIQFVAESGCYIAGYDCRVFAPHDSCDKCPLRTIMPEYYVVVQTTSYHSQDS